MGFLDDLKSIFIGDYKAGIESAYDGSPVIYINPDEFDYKYYRENDKVSPEDVKKLRTLLEEGGIDTTTISDEEIGATVIYSMTKGPFAGIKEFPVSKDGQEKKPFCIANEEGANFGNKNVSAPLLSGVDIEKLKEIPGSQDHWDRFFGIHEGTHCQQHIELQSIPPEELDLHILRFEAEADRAGINWLRENNLKDIAQAIIDYRALGTLYPDSANHATAILIDNPDTPVTKQHLEAAEKFFQTMNSTFAEINGVSEDEAIGIYNNDTEAYIKNVEHLLSQGAFDGLDNPYIKETIKAYVGAYERQVLKNPDYKAPPEYKDKEQAPNANPDTDTDTNNNHNYNDDKTSQIDIRDIRGGKPVVTLADGNSATMSIGGISAPDFFASHADLNLAQQRIELAPPEPLLEQHFDRSSSPSV